MATNSLTALITGGTSGIGRAAANKLTSLGIHVIVVGRNTQRGDKTVAEIRAAGGEADFISSDLRDASRHLPPAKVPKQVLIVAELPKSDRGKVLRDRLREDWTARMKGAA